MKGTTPINEVGAQRREHLGLSCKFISTGLLSERRSDPNLDATMLAAGVLWEPLSALRR